MERNETEKIIFEFYGIGVMISGPDVFIRKLRKDFSYFQRKGAGLTVAVNLAIEEKEPPYERVPAVKASLYHPDFLAYDCGGTRYVDYKGKALCIYDYAKEQGFLYSRDGDLLHELAYLLVHSRVGELLDRAGFHRVHALGLSRQGKGVLCLLPQGGGKTTLCLELMKDPGIMLLSDDTPLITRTGGIHAFPVRIGLKEMEGGAVPERFITTMVRRKHGEKILLDAMYYEARIAERAVSSLILIGEREFSGAPRLVPVNKFIVFMAMFRNCIIGLGLPQVIEYFLRYTLSDIAGKIRILLCRVMASFTVTLRSRGYRFVMGRDPRANAALLLEFLKNEENK